MKFKKRESSLDLVAHAYKPSTRETEAGGLLNEMLP